MNTYDFPTIGPAWVSDLIYAGISAFIRFVEWFYGLVDAIFGDLS